MIRVLVVDDHPLARAGMIGEIRRIAVTPAAAGTVPAATASPSVSSRVVEVIG